jgi:hypothetical protein
MMENGIELGPAGGGGPPSTSPGGGSAARGSNVSSSPVDASRLSSRSVNMISGIDGSASYTVKSPYNGTPQSNSSNSAQSNGGQPWDSNTDGVFQKSEADNWWQNGGGKQVNVNNAQIDWSGLTIPKGAEKGDVFSISTTKAFVKLPYKTAATYGGTSFKVISALHVQVLDQMYHYNLRQEYSVENGIRNLITIQGKPDGTGTDFMIHYYNPIILIK